MNRSATTAYGRARDRVRAGEAARDVARELVAAMTLDEKLGCLDGDTEFWDGLVDITRGGYYEHPWPAARVERLGFPGLSFSDGPRGVVVGRSTCFPVTMARGASFDAALEERIGEAIGAELRIQGADFYGGVCVNLLRHPAWGRAQETYGEDPCHLGEMGAALVRGVQRWAMACTKHFACNSIENARFKIDVAASQAVLEDVYLRHFRRIVDEGVASVMTSYNALNGVWCGDSPELLTTFLRERWNFEGFTVSDFIYGLRDPVGSLRAGLDIEMPYRQQRALALGPAIESGELSEAEVDRAVLRVVATILRFHAALPDEAPPRSRLAGDAHRALAREAAAASLVLLRNEGRLLPLDPARIGRIAVVGRLAATPNLGDGGSSNVHPPTVATPLDGLRAALPGAEFTDDAASADVAVVVCGCTFEDEGEFTGGFSPALAALMPPAPEDASRRMDEAVAEGKGMALGGDRRSLRLRDDDVERILATAAAQPNTVVLLMGGSAFVVEEWIDRVPAVLQVWYPGMEGGHAIADVLLGKTDPGGRLPFTVPTDESHLPPFDPDADRIVYDQWHGQWLLDRDGHAPRFPYGFGLSYGHPSVERAELRGESVAATVRNDGERAASAVVFFFEPKPPTKRLFAFRKLRLEAGETGVVEAALDGRREVVVALHAGDPNAVVLRRGS